MQRPETETLGGTSRIYFAHNLVHDYANTGYGSGVCKASLVGDVTDLAFDHNTVIPKSVDVASDRPQFMMYTVETVAGAAPHIRISNNILHGGNSAGSHYVFAHVGGDGETELGRISGSSHTLENTMIIDGLITAFPGGEVTCPANIAAVNFTSDNPALGLDGDSPAKNAASDGTDIGCDYAKVNLATSGVE